MVPNINNNDVYLNKVFIKKHNNLSIFVQNYKFMELILKYFPKLTDDQIDKFTRLEGLYQDWNLKINVVSRKDIDELYLRHVLHSLAIAKVHSFAPGTKVLDVGTGGGFPGIPLAILFPKTQFYLVDSIGKKIKVVNEVIAGADLKNATAINED